MTITENSVTHPIEDFVWCENCGCPHPADFATMTLSEGWPHGDGGACESIEMIETNVILPPDWERTYHATYTEPGPDGKMLSSGGGYDLWLQHPPLQDFHHPMYYLERTT